MGSKKRKKRRGQGSVPAARASSPDQRSEPAQEQHPDGIPTIYTQEQRYSGPLPPPEILEEFDRVAPGAAERIISMAERQALHRQGLESRVVSANIGNERRGQWIGGGVALASIGGAVAIGILGNPTAGATATIFVVGFFVHVFRTALKLARREQKNAGGD